MNDFLISIAKEADILPAWRPTPIGDLLIGDAAVFVRQEVVRLRRCYPMLVVAPLFYTVEDGMLHQVRED